MNWFFENKDNQEKLFESISSWQGTPFRNCCGIKGVGVDCMHFIMSCLFDLGLVEEYKPNRLFNHQGHLHSKEEKILNRVKEFTNFVEVSSKDIMNGDLVFYQFGRRTSHIGIYFDERVYQVFNRYGASQISWDDDRWKKRVTLCCRALKGCYDNI